MAKRFRDSADPFKIVIVRDMWLTGFDAPSLSTMYADKPMRGHGLMQAIARVNRVFKDKPGGLVVDYLGLAAELKEALATYTEAGGTGKTALDESEAVGLMLTKYGVCLGLFHGFDRSRWLTGTPAQRLSLLPAAQEHILAQEDGKNRLLRAVMEPSQAFALAVPHDDAIRIRDDVGFFQAVRAVLAKNVPGESKTNEQIDHAIRQIISKAMVSDEALGLNDDEVAFYDALETNDSAVKVLGDDALRTIARELVATVRANVTIDWTVRENVRAQLRVLVKRILRKYGYPPDMQEKATQTVLEQAELLSEGWESWAA